MIQALYAHMNKKKEHREMNDRLALVLSANVTPASLFQVTAMALWTVLGHCLIESEKDQTWFSDAWVNARQKGPEWCTWLPVVCGKERSQEYK
jgi:hypothetical protein